MSTKINLLPDVRQAKIQDKSRRRLAVAVMAGSVMVLIGALLLGFLTEQAQRLTINSLTNSIKDKKTQINNTPDIKTMLSLQARLAALPKLYSDRVLMTKLNKVLSGLEPSDTAFTDLSIDNNHQLTFNATGKTYLTAARIAKALEASNVSVGDGAAATNEPYFSDVQLSAVTSDSGTTTYSVTATVNQGATSGQ